MLVDEIELEAWLRDAARTVQRDLPRREYASEADSHTSRPTDQSGPPVRRRLRLVPIRPIQAPEEVPA